MVIPSTDDLDESIRFYTETLGMTLKFRDGAHDAAIAESGGGVIKGPYDDAHERSAVVYDNRGSGPVFYRPLKR